MIKQLDKQRIELSCVAYGAIQDEDLLRQYRALLSPEERSRGARFYFEKDRHRFWVTRALVRTVLAPYLGLPPEAVRFTANSYGMPLIAGASQDLRFNISHTSQMIVLAVTTGRALGIDIENWLQRKAAIDAAHHFFSEEESRALARLPEAEQGQRFFEYWTLKESYIKARGMGLSIPLDRFSFGLETIGEIQFKRGEQLQDPVSHWSFSQYQIGDEYRLALCVEQTNQPEQTGHKQQAPSIHFYQTIPLVSESVFHPILTRRSH